MPHHKLCPYEIITRFRVVDRKMSPGIHIFMPKKFDTATFVQKANHEHNSKYNYSQVQYVNYRTPIKIICPQHGVFEQVPNDHLFGTRKNGKRVGCGCPYCGIIQRTGINSGRWEGHGEIGQTYWSQCQRGAQIRNIPFEITIDHAWKVFLKQKRLCTLSGQVLSMPERHLRKI